MTPDSRPGRDDVIEGKIIASRLGAAVVEGAGSEWNDLRLRMKRLERGDDLASDDPLRPGGPAQALLKAWTDQASDAPHVGAGARRRASALAQRYKEAYIQANAFPAAAGHCRRANRGGRAALPRRCGARPVINMSK